LVLASLSALLTCPVLAQRSVPPGNAIRDAQAKSASIRDALREQVTTLKVLDDELRKIDGLSQARADRLTSVQSAILSAAAAQKGVAALTTRTDSAADQLRLLDSDLDSALASIAASQDSERPLKRLDETLTPTVATSLAAASLTLAGLLLGLGMPLLLSSYSLPDGTAGAQRLTTDFRIEVARAGVFALKAFGFFALAILENVTLDPSDASLFDAVKASVGLWIDVGINGSALMIGMWFLVRAAQGLIGQTGQLIKVWEVVNAPSKPQSAA
jgi:hypothetical protein